MATKPDSVSDEEWHDYWNRDDIPWNPWFEARVANAARDMLKPASQ